MERIELTDADIERIDALGSEPRAHVLLERLSPEQRDAIRAHVIDERPYGEIAAHAGHFRGGRAPARQPRPGRDPQANGNGTRRMSDDFFLRLERQLEAAELRELKRAPALRRIVNPRRLLSVPLAAAAAVGVVVVVLAVLGAIDNDDADRRPQPVGTVPAPRVEVVVTDVERGLLFGLDGRVLTVQMLPDIPDASYETLSGARISATCGTNRRRVIRGARSRSPGSGRPTRRAWASASRATSRAGAGSRTSPAASSRP